MDESPPKRVRRSSILKGSRAPLSNLEDNEFEEDRTTYTRTATLKRRVSFSSTNRVQEFCHEADGVWGEKYEKPMMPVENGIHSAPEMLEASSSFQSLLTGEIKKASSCASLTVNTHCQVSYSQTESRTIHFTPATSQDDDDEEMELTAPAVFSQDSQPLTQQSQVTVIDKENLLEKTSANMSMDASLPEDYADSPKGFNTTRFSEHGLDETEDSSDDLLNILKGNKTVNESACMDMTTFNNRGDPPLLAGRQSLPSCAGDEIEEERTEDLAKVFFNSGPITMQPDEDSTYEMLKVDKGTESSQSSVDTEDVVPKENVHELSKHRLSMDISMAPLQVSGPSMEMTLAPATEDDDNSEVLLAPSTPDMSLGAPLLDKTSRQPIEMSFEEEEKSVSNKSCRKSLNKTDYLTADISVDDDLGSWKIADNKTPEINTTKSLLNSNFFNSTIPIADNSCTPDQSVPAHKASAPSKNYLRSGSSDLTILDKTYEVLDGTALDVPDDSTVFKGVQEDEWTDRESKKSLQRICSRTQRLETAEGSFVREQKSVHETWKAGGGVPFQESEDIGEMRFEDAGRVSISLHQTEASGTRCPEEERSPEKVELNGGQELLLSPRTRPTLVQRSPQRSPLCRSFNAPIFRGISATSAEGDGDNEMEVSSLAQAPVSKRRQPLEHSPVKKKCVLDKSVSSAPPPPPPPPQSIPVVRRTNFEAEFMRCDSRVNQESSMSNQSVAYVPCPKRPESEEMDFSRRSEPDKSNRTLDCSQLSISFIPPNLPPPVDYAAVLAQMDAILERPRQSRIKDLCRKMDDVLNWFEERQRKKEQQKMDTDDKEKVTLTSVQKEEKRPEVEERLSPVAAKIRDMNASKNKSWSLVKDQKFLMEFTLLNDTMKMQIILDENDVVDDIRLPSVTSSESPADVDEFSHRLFLKGVSKAELLQKCKRKKDVPDLLKKLKPRLDKFTNLVKSIKEASYWHVLAFRGSTVAFKLHSRKLLLLSEVCVDFARWEKITEGDVDVQVAFGKLDCKEVKELVAYEKANEHFLLKYIQSVEEYIGTKEAFA